ncbi:MAG: ABC transporter permease, partial [Betaproteobacteria bacterium]
MPKIVILWTDAAVWLMLAALLAYGVAVWRAPEKRQRWGRVFRDGAALASSIVLLLALGVTLLDSVHYRPLLPAAPGAAPGPAAYDTRTRSLLDALLADLVDGRESTYSKPLAYLGFTKESVVVGGEVQRVAPRLQFGGAHLADPATQWLPDLVRRASLGLAAGAVGAAVAVLLLVAALARARGAGLAATWLAVRRHELPVPWHVAVATLAVVGLVAGPATALSGPYH